MKKLRNVWEALQSRLRGQEAALKYAQGKHHYWRPKAEAAHKRWEEIKNHPGVGNPDGAVPSFGRARRRWERRHKRQIYWKGRIKRQHNRISHLEKSIAEIDAELKKYHDEHKVHFLSPNKVRGGTPNQCQHVASLKAMGNYQIGKQEGYYSQGGAYPDYGHSIAHMPKGHRYDCSSWRDGINYVCGLESPSGGEYKSGGYTATELSFSQKISRSEVRPGDGIVYLSFPGDTTGHHTEIVDDPDRPDLPGGMSTIGHGDEAINAGVADNFGDGLYEFRRMVKPCPALN